MATCPDATSLTELSPANKGAGLGIFVVGNTFLVASLAWWWIWRDAPALRRRHFSLTCAAALAVAMFLVTTPLVNVLGRDCVPCDLHLAFTYLVLPVGAGPILARLVLFHNKAVYQRLLARAALQEGTTFRLDGFRRQVSRAAAAKKLATMLIFRRQRSATKDALTATADTSKGDGAGPGDQDPENPSGRSRAGSSLSSMSSARRARFQALYLATTEPVGWAVVMVMVIIAVIIILRMVLMADSPYGKGCYGCTISGADFVPFTMQVAISFLLGIFMLIVVRNEPDPMGILFELRLCWAVAFVMIASIAMSIVDPGQLRNTGTFDWLYIANLATLMFFAIQGPYQVYKARCESFVSAAVLQEDLRGGSSRTLARLESAKSLGTNKHRSRFLGRGMLGVSIMGKSSSSLGTEGITLDTVLATPAGKKHFEAYLATEFSLENMFFLDAVKRYREACDSHNPREVTMRAVDIYTTFIRERSMLEVNISSAARRRLTEELEPLRNAKLDAIDKCKLEATIFEAAETEIHMLLSSDSFQRFLRSKQCRAWARERNALSTVDDDGDDEEEVTSTKL